ncbi:MAG: mannitol dehydrogenase family protein [Clostridiales bacterium]|nr:mannitol dehydrogenase family protein [Clostridiales bacterium]MDO4350645.1 mannitol dehydrogenase family protein [Eubacteriales bacterium]MDY4009342.1 mannitol dehydrogenase family protein [Candidatus Limiplasma sp.]
MKLSANGLSNAQAWQAAGISLPGFDWRAMCDATQAAPVWVHFGAGNIFRGFIAALQQRLLDQGLEKSGIVAAETFDYDIIDKIYAPHDSMTLMVSLLPDGGTRKEVIASIAQGIKANSADQQQWAALCAIFEKPSLQMASFTITEKGYALRDMKGELMGVVKQDMEDGPAKARHAMSVVAALMLKRFEAGAAPMALVSMDNCSHNGEKLRQSVLEIAHAWLEKGHVPAGFIAYLEDEQRVSFPWSMIDKITPRPSEIIEKQLAQLGVEDMAPVVTSRNTYIAPFVNAEAPQYLVVEDRFPNGRPALEKAGVYMTDRETVNMTERMKVTTCLNPLHTALAVYGCLLGYKSIADEMADPQLKALVERIGYVEGLPVVTDPGILSPRAFIDEVVTQRLPNPFIPDTPQRIATDTSQKIPIRFGETIKSYMASPELDATSLTAIPLALAGWLRYLLGVDDEGKEMAVSADPMLAQLQQTLGGVALGKPESADGVLKPILENPVLFGVNLYEAGLAGKVEGLFAEMLAGPGAVRATLKKYL